ncbi:MAG TPA: IMP cyclohydrolase [Bacillota bacterium]|jgi:IMP cyclohydrolase|nr:IMP cyclohydrolase [Bacillota bacterium]HOL11048.1 IMP cyclohydrolase [Bacillota bacterium]HPO98811.1 IMP cyclohydrolase [Bacillota bacterium]
MSDLHQIAESNMNKLKENVYPGRGIVIGQTPDGNNMVQVYWIMGRSDNSRNRIFVEADGFVKTQAFDESKVVDPSLIIYYPLKFVGDCHIISNGDQTDTIYNSIKSGGTFEAALNTREFEPDAPNFTPRISGVIDFSDPVAIYKLAINKTAFNQPEFGQRQYFNYQKALAGFGHCIHTYQGDGNPLPSFTGEPYLVRLLNNIDETANLYWSLLNNENKISLLVKFIDIKTKATKLKILNKHLGD